MPKPFGRILDLYFSPGSYEIQEGYADSVDHSPLPEGCACLRAKLGISDDETCSDCYCVVKDDNGKLFGFIFEDKDIETHRSRETNDAIRQMDYTHSKIRAGNMSNATHAILSNAKLSYPYEARTLSGQKLKVLMNLMNNKPVKIKNSDIPINIVNVR